MLITIYKSLNYERFPKCLKGMCLLCVSLYTLLEELVFYHYVNLLNYYLWPQSTPLLCIYEMELLYLVLEDS